MFALATPRLYRIFGTARTGAPGGPPERSAPETD
ncbi:hypothetical protein HDA36_005468 [Nocardiopsis composta]|uniref:Uncharacterized protein n=1 Tax=Nocardiopsis composta TaxID=157465 RepID=A0A7W8QRK9_9ACTN|nr:hypothetical protein [Nocardiopsis composta]